MTDFDGILSNAAEQFYDSAIEPNTGCLEEFLDCEDEDDVEDILSDYRYSDNGEESLNYAIDDALMYTNDAWAVIMNYSDPSDIFGGKADGLAIYDEFADDVFDKTKEMIKNDLEELKQKAQENED